MQTILSRIFAIGGVISVCAAAGPGAFAQGYIGPYNGNHRHFHVRRVEQQISMLQAAYAHDVAIGDYAAAARDHRHAQALRSRLRDSRYSNGGYGYRGDRDYPNDGRY